MLLHSRKTRLSRIGVCKLLLIGVASWQATILEAADLEFDYPRTRLALSALAKIHDSSPDETKPSVALLDDLARDIDTVRRLSDRGDAAVDRLKQLHARLAELHEQYDAKAVLNQLWLADSDACLKLMIQWDWLRQDKGKLAIIDPSRGRQEASGVQLIAPIRFTEAVKVDKYGYQGEQFQYPYALSETEYLVTFSSKGSKKGRDRAEEPFGIHFMTIDGQRELLAADPEISCNQSVPLISRPVPSVQPSQVDYRRRSGTYIVHDVYQGSGLRGIERGTVKRLRVVALEFRAAGIGSNGNRGLAGGALVSTPISINGAWDVKKVLGSATVYEDGSAAFTVPARTPVYFQALDDRNQVVQTMRSWSTLQPGETFACVGCHADKNTAPASSAGLTQAMKAGPQSLEPLYDEPHGFSFPRLIQPILDRHCAGCHNRKAVAGKKSSISLEGAGTFDERSLKTWSDAYQALTDSEIATWVSPQSAPPMLPPYHAGAANSRLTEMLADGHQRVKLTDSEMDLISCWIDLGVPFAGSYTESMAAKQIDTYQHYADKRRRWAAEEARQIEALIRVRNQLEDR